MTHAFALPPIAERQRGHSHVLSIGAKTLARHAAAQSMRMAIATAPRDMPMVGLAPIAKGLKGLGPTPYDAPYNCKGDGVTNDQVGFKRWFEENKVMVLPPGDFLIDGGLVANGPKIVYGVGAELVTVRTNSGTEILMNGTFVDPDYGFNGGPRIDSIKWTGTHFAGNPDVEVPAGHGMFVFIGAKLDFTDCEFSGFRRDIVIMANCTGKFTRPEATNYGVKGPFNAPGSGTFYGGMFGFCVRACYDLTFDQPWIHDTDGGGIWTGTEGRCVSVLGARIDGCVEAGIVGACPGSLIEIISCRNVRRVDVSGHPAELQGYGYSVRFVRLEDCDGAGLYITDPKDVTVSGGTVDRVNRMYDGMNACIIIRTYTSNPEEAANGITLSGMGLSATDGNGAHAITLVNWSGNNLSLQRAVAIIGNNTGDPAQWKTGALGFIPSDKPHTKSAVWAPGCRVAGNIGIADQLAA